MTSALTIGGIVISVAFAAAFIAMERRVGEPDPRPAVFSAAARSPPRRVSATANYVTVAAAYVLMPFYLIHGRGLSATSTGLVMAVQPIAQVLASPFAGTLSDRIGTRIPRTAGLVLLMLAFLSLVPLDATRPWSSSSARWRSSGLGIGIFSAPNTAQIMSAAPTERRGTANAVSATSRYLGFAIGYGDCRRGHRDGWPGLVRSGDDPSRGADPRSIAAAFAAIGAAFAALPD